MTIRLKIGNTFDLPGTRYSEFYHYRTLDRRNALQFWYKGNKNRIETKKAKGKEVKEKVITYDEYEIKFICDVDFAHIIAMMNILDYFVVTINDVEITPDEWETEIIDIVDYNESFRKCKILYRINFMDSKTANYEEDADNQAPVASAVRISGFNTIGSLLTGIYTYSDYESDAEGTSTFRWWRADTHLGVGLALIGGATAQTYTITTSDYNKYIFFEVTPVAATGTTPGIAVKSKALQAETNSAPTATFPDDTDGIISDSGNYTINEDWTGDYVFNDIDSDAEGTSIYYWQQIDNDLVNNLTLVGNTLTHVFLTPSINKFGRFGIKPVAATGINASDIYWSDWHIINSLI